MQTAKVSKAQLKLLKRLALDPTGRLHIHTLTTPSKETAWIKGDLHFPVRMATVRALERTGLLLVLRKPFPGQVWAGGEYALAEKGREIAQQENYATLD